MEDWLWTIEVSNLPIPLRLDFGRVHGVISRHNEHRGMGIEAVLAVFQRSLVVRSLVDQWVQKSHKWGCKLWWWQIKQFKRIRWRHWDVLPPRQGANQLSTILMVLRGFQIYKDYWIKDKGCIRYYWKVASWKSLATKQGMELRMQQVPLTCTVY